MEDELNQVGIEAVGGQSTEEQKFISYDDLLYRTKIDPAIQAVVVSLDSKYNHTKVVMASITLQQPNIKLIVATDATSKQVNGRRMPDVGSFTNSIVLSLPDKDSVKREVATNSTMDFIQKDFGYTDEQMKEALFL